jgi:group I intron endonuclease
MGIIYKVTNKTDGKFYIGKTTKTLDIRKKEHEYRSKYTQKQYFHNAINKYGFSNFDWEIIDTALTLNELNEKEIFYINELSATIEYKNYNLTSGGDGGCFVLKLHPNEKEIRIKMSNSHIGKKKI